MLGETTMAGQGATPGRTGETTREYTAPQPEGHDLPALDGELIPPSRGVKRHYSTAEEIDLGGKIRAEHEAGERAAKEAVKHFRRCGDLLLELKAVKGHGEFGRHLAAIGIKPRTAQIYMRLAREFPKLPPAKANRVAQLSLRDAMGELATNSGRIAKLPGPAMDRALADARREPIKVAVSRAVTNQVVRAAQVRPVAQEGGVLPSLDEEDDDDTGVATPEQVAEMQAHLDRIIGQPRAPGACAIRPDSGTQMAGDVIDFLCRVPVTKYVPADPTEITDKKMIEAIDSHFERAIPWIFDFAAAWREHRTDEIERLPEGACRLIDGIVGHIWAIRQERPDLTTAEIRAALNHVFRLIGRGIFNWGDAA